ncbi:hypothetical protein ZWY2020_059134 [Hordeum vulgare]|nr:hypothetical protein ZWY2020_059134 [Hordeum vulgare]
MADADELLARRLDSDADGCRTSNLFQVMRRRDAEATIRHQRSEAANQTSSRGLDQDRAVEPYVRARRR